VYELPPNTQGIAALISCNFSLDGNGLSIGIMLPWPVVVYNNHYQLSLIWEFPSSRNQVKMQSCSNELSQSEKSGYDFHYCEPLNFHDGAPL
jgi:hypothetical protein